MNNKIETIDLVGDIGDIYTVMKEYRYLYQDREATTIDKEKWQQQLKIMKEVAQICSEISKIEEWFLWYNNEIIRLARNQRLKISTEDDLTALDMMAVTNEDLLKDLKIKEQEYYAEIKEIQNSTII